MTSIKFAVPAAAVKPEFEALDPGEYTGTLVEIRQTKIRSGRHQNKPSVDVAIQMEDGRYIWKVLPLFTDKQYAALEDGDKRWVQLSTVSFAKAFKTKGEINPDELVGKSVMVQVGIHQSNGYGIQNSIVKFIKTV
jgi:hypothetical protein